MKAIDALVLASRTIDPALLNDIFNHIKEAAEAGEIKVTLPRVFTDAVNTGLEAFGYEVSTEYFDTSKQTGLTTISWRNAK